MAFKFLTSERIARLIEALAPRFLGRDQDHLVAFADEVADISYDILQPQVEALQDFDADLQSPYGAAMIGIQDAGGFFGGVGNVEDALQLAGSVTTGLVIDSIADADTTHAPSRNAVFDALAGKQAASANLTSWSAIAPSTKADLASPVFTGNPTAPTPLTADNDTSIATTAFVKAQGYTNNTGTVTSVGITPGTGLSVTGSPITTSGSFSLSLSANLQSWSGIAPSAKADDSSVVHLAGAETITGVKTFNVGANWGAAAGASATDTTRHIQLHSSNGGYGFGITTNTLNIIAGTLGNVQINTNGSAATSFKFGSDAIFYGSGWNNSTGYSTINPGNATNAGYLAWFGADNVRRGYFGWGAGDNTLQLKAEGSYHVNFVIDAETNWPTLNASQIGFRGIPRITTGLYKGGMFATAAGLTVPASTYAAGDTLSVYNDSAAAITLTQGAGLTMRKAGTATTGNLTLAARGIATIWFNSTTECIVSGNV